MATTTATSATSSIFFNSHTKTQYQSKPITLISFSSSNFLQKRNNLNLQRMHLRPSRLELRKHSKVGSKKESLSADEEIQSLVPDGGASVVHQVEVFSWTSVILPFLFPALGGLLFGYDIGATSGATISLQSPELSGTTWFNLSSIKLGLVAMHGAPLYISETCPSQIRGTLISMNELMIVLGILLGYLAGSLEIDAIGGWRYMSGFSAPVAVLIGLGIWTLPESPRWLLLRAVQGKASLQEYKEKAIVGLSRLRGRPAGDKVSEKQVDETLVSLKEAYAVEGSEGSFWEVFQGPSLKAFTIGGGLFLFQQITGQPSVLYYAGSILQTAGFAAASDVARVSVVIGLFKFLMTGVAILKVDDLGRRPLLIEGVSGITASLLFLSAYYKILQGYPLVAVAALLLYVGCYQISFGPISWLMVSEIFPIRTRGRGISLAVLTNFGANALVTFAFSPLKELLGADNLFLLFPVLL